MKIMHLVSALSLLAPAVALADPAENLELASSFDHAVGAPSNAFEIGVSTGYSQGAGPIGGGLAHVEDVARAGASVEVDVGYRITPHFSVGAFGTFAGYSKDSAVASGTDILGATAGVQATAHLRPDRSVDPWVSLGTGWKGLWLSPSAGKNTSLQGLELARLQLGVDYRLNENIAIAPVIGGALDLYVSQDSPMTDGYTELSDKKVNFTGFAGLAGRFDLGGKR